MDEKKEKVRKPTGSPKWVRKTDSVRGGSNGTSKLAKQFLPEAKTFKEKAGLLGLKARDDKRPLTEKLRDGLEWMLNKYQIVFKHRSECVDQHEYECLLITHSAISDFSVGSFIFSLHSEVEELPYIPHYFNPRTYADENIRNEEKRAEFISVVDEIEKVFVQTKKDLRKYIENDAYFLNAQTRSHTIWFLEHFFKSDIEEPDTPSSGKITFEVKIPSDIPQEVKDALGTK